MLMGTIEWATLFQGVQTEVTAGIEAVLPLAVTIFGILAAVGIGLRIFRKVGAR